MIPTLVAALSLGLAGQASALEVTAANNELKITDTTGDMNVLWFYRGQDENNHQVIYVHQSTGPTDLPPGTYPDNFPPPQAAPLLPDLANHCAQAGNGTVKCTSTGEAFTKVTAKLGAQRDFISNPIVSGAQKLAPVTAVSLDGEADSDVVSGTDNGDTLTGAGGDDELRGLAGNDTLLPGDGQNTLRGGDGSDLVDFSGADRSRANQDTFVTIDNFPNDGASCATVKSPIPAGCEGNNVRNDVEDITTGNGNDQIIGSDNVNKITTNGGADRVTALAGDDQLLLGDGNDFAEGNDGIDTIGGGAGKDELHGNAGNDTINGNAANVGDADDENTLFGDAGSDTINGAAAKDTISAGDDNDIVHAGNGNNVIDLGAGNDGTETDPVDMAGTGNDTVTGGSGVDVIKTGLGDDVINGGSEADHIVAGPATQNDNDTDDDKALGGDGIDTIATGEGNDYLQGGAGADGLDAGAQDTKRQSRQFAGEAGLPAQAFHGDTIDYSDKTDPVYAIVGNSNSGTNCAPPAATNCEGDSITSAENFIGGENNDWFVGDANANTLSGHGGNDKLDGQAGNDILFGGAGDDNQLLGGAGGDWISGGDGTDSVSYLDQAHNGVNVTLNGQADDGSPGEGDNLQADLENIEGSDGDDYLEGSDILNHLWGREGNDELVGKGGPDTLEGNGGVDLANYEARQDDLNISLNNVADDGGAGEGDNVMDSVENIDTGSGKDVIVGSDVDNVIHANGGADTLDGLRGSDDLNGGDGPDTAIYSGRPSTEKVEISLDGAPNDGTTLLFGTSSVEKDNVNFDIENVIAGDEMDQIDGSPVDNVINSGGGDDTVFGNQGNDKVIGGAGNDELFGGADNDGITPGTGADIVFGEGATDYVDYTERALGSVTVTLDGEANDGEAGEGDNVNTDVEQVHLPGDTSGGTTGGDNTAGSGQEPQPQPQPQAEQSQDQQQTQQQQGQQQVSGSSDNNTTKVNPTTETKDSTSTSSAKSSSLQTSATVGKKVRGARTVLVRGRILVKAKKGLAKASASCKGGGKVLVTIRKGSKVVGKRLVRVSKTCTFLAPVKLKRGAHGNLKVQVRFLGNRVLKPTKRTTKLQVNG
jgi:Ca2+-binding RTX toxin-like protein